MVVILGINERFWLCRVLYEKWRKENEGTDDDDDIEDNGRNLTANPLSKRSPPPEDAGIQKVGPFSSSFLFVSPPLSGLRKFVENPETSRVRL